MGAQKKKKHFPEFLSSSTKSNSECRKTFIIPTSTRTKPFVPSRHVAQGVGQNGAQDTPDVRNGMAQPRSSTKPRLGSLHDSRSGTSYPIVQATFVNLWKSKSSA